MYKRTASLSFLPEQFERDTADVHEVLVQVIDRRAAISALQPDIAKQPELYHSKHHLNAQANHAFNWQLLRRLEDPSNATVSASEQASRMWKQILSSQQM
jgi:hypothetical protein